RTRRASPPPTPTSGPRSSWPTARPSRRASTRSGGRPRSSSVASRGAPQRSFAPRPRGARRQGRRSSEVQGPPRRPARGDRGGAGGPVHGPPGEAWARRRPMRSGPDPLGRMGAAVVGRAQATRLPLAVKGRRPLWAIAHTSPVASAQVKSAILLAGLYADGPVSVEEPAPSRDHSERMLRQFGARLRVDGGAVTLEPGDLRGTTVHIPGDISSAAFLLVAAAIVPDARVTVTRVGVNPTRTGILVVLEAMGARVESAGAGA